MQTGDPAGCPAGFAAAPPGFGASSGPHPSSYPEPPKKKEKITTPGRLRDLPIKALRGVLKDHGISYAHCVEKSELVQLVVEKLGLPVEIEA